MDLRYHLNKHITQRDMSELIERLKSVTFWNDADKNFINFQDQFTHPEHVLHYLHNLWSNNMLAFLEETRGKSIRPQSFESTHMRDRVINFLVRNEAIQPVSISMRQIRKVGHVAHASLVYKWI